MELSIHHLFMDTLFRIIKQLGCSRGCGEGRRETDAIKLKDNVLKTLKYLYDISEYHFVKYCEMLVTSHPVQEVIDIFHAFLGFCAETTTTTTATHLSAFPCLKKGHFDAMSKSGYLNNFGFANNLTKGNSDCVFPNIFKLNNTHALAAKWAVEAIIIKCIFKPFITRLVLIQKELKVQENMSLYCEIRQFISYVRDHHGSVFRNVCVFIDG